MNRTSTWIAVVVAVVVIVAVLAVMVGFWSGLGDAGMSAAGWTALVLGVVFSLALGIGLMALLFISNRRGYDDPDAPRR